MENLEIIKDCVSFSHLPIINIFTTNYQDTIFPNKETLIHNILNSDITSDSNNSTSITPEKLNILIYHYPVYLIPLLCPYQQVCILLL